VPGGAASFSVTAQGTPALQYQWLFEGAPIADATNVSFNLTQAFSTNSGTYSVIVSNAFGYTNSSGAFLAVVPLLALGNNAFGQGSIVPALTNIVAIAAGGYHNLALRNDGTVVAWGNNINGQCNVPVSVSNAVAIAAGGYHSLALLDDGTVAGWGDDSLGQIDFPNLGNNIIAIAAGGSHGMALRNDGTVIAWGDNSWGQTNIALL
jgi:alpha-tubulin suppressor-like RCC1 family protein